MIAVAMSGGVDSSVVAAMLQAFDWAYGKAVDGMPGLDGAEDLARDFAARHASADQAIKALILRHTGMAGAAGFVLKHAAATELVAAIREAVQGRTYVTPLIAADLLREYRDRGDHRATDFGQLTPRQREVLQLVAEGHSAKEIARLLHISPRTAEFHKARLMETLGATSTADLVRHAIHHGLTPG